MKNTDQERGAGTTAAPVIAVFGTGSDVGKSVVATALCRSFVRAGKRVAPYKAQNMSNNSGVTPEGLEMGRAQIVQAEAAGIVPAADMNPILLKPTSDVGAQVVLNGRVWDNRTAADYHRTKEPLFAQASAALDRLRAANDLIVMEGAGSCAEVNLAPHDIVNFRMAEHADAPVLLVADIHKGGVFAQIVGTLACLPEDRQARIAGFIVNRFRGDIDLFRDGVRWIEEKTGKPVFGVLPWFSDFRIDAEDSVVIERPVRVPGAAVRPPAVGVIRIPHIANFTDIDAVDAVNGLSVHFLESPQDLAPFAAVILPGSKNTRGDLEWLHETGWTRELTGYADAGGHVLGICGGYQMMGRAVHDPGGLEGRPGTTPGLDLLPVETVLKAPKTTTRARFLWDTQAGEGYEIHMGQTERLGGAPLFSIVERNGQPMQVDDGCVARDGRCLGTYLHGFLDSPAVIGRWLAGIGCGDLEVPVASAFEARQVAYDRLAVHFEAFVDVEGILGLCRAGR